MSDQSHPLHDFFARNAEDADFPDGRDNQGENPPYGNEHGAFGYASPNIGVTGVLVELAEPPITSDDTKQLPPIVVPDYLDPDVETVSLTSKGEHALKMMREKYVKLEDVQQEYRVFMRFVAAMLGSDVTHNQRRGQVELLGVILKSSLLSLEADANDGIPF